MFFKRRRQPRGLGATGSKGLRCKASRRRNSRVLLGELLERRDMLAITPQALLPDLTPWANVSKEFIYGWTIVGNDLRLTTAMANIGTGAMEMRGGATHGETQDVYQRVLEPDGNFTDVLAGTFTYHPEHGHIHFDEFAQFRLRQVLPNGGVGDIVAAGDKVSFCLLDVERYDTSGPFLPRFLNCGQIQGISVGWADVYNRGLEGQSIEITNVPDGNYWLEVVVDPENHIVESNELNNVTRIQISLVRPPGGGGIAPDAFEANNSFETASILAPPEDHTYPNLSIHASTNADFYRVTASESGPMAFRASFLNSQGDVDLEVFDSTRTRVGRSDSTQNSEQVSINAVAGQYYYVRVYGYNGATNPNYTLVVDQPEGVSGGAPDQFEDNDTFATARGLAAIDQAFANLNINTSGDDDYYKITPTNSGLLSVSLAFLHAEGDIDLEILTASQARLDRSDSSGNSEQASVQVTAGQTYYIRVYGYRGAVNEHYSMTIDVPAPLPPPVVRYLSTTDGGTLNSTDGSPRLTVADSDIVRLTVQGNGTYGYQLRLDGSDVGLTTSSEDIDAFVFLPDGSIVISTVGVFSVPGAGGTTITGGGEDLLRFVPTSLGANTAGTWSMYFDGSDVGLSGSNENIDTVAVLADGRILVSTSGAFSVNGGVTGEDEDLVAFTPTSLGATTAGTWAVYVDGSDIGLGTNDGEDVNGLYVRETGGNPILYLSTVGNFSVPGSSGANEDVVAFTPASLGANTTGTFASALALDGSVYGLAALDVDGMFLVPPVGGVQALVQGGSSFGASGTSLARAIAAPTVVGAKDAASSSNGSTSSKRAVALVLAANNSTTTSRSTPGVTVVTPVVEPIAGSSKSSKKAKTRK